MSEITEWAEKCADQEKPHVEGGFGKAEGLVQEGPFKQFGQDEKTDQGHGFHEDQLFQDVLFLPVAHLMSQDGLDFVGAVRLKQSIEEDDSFALSQSGEISIGMFAPFAGIHLKNPFSPQPRFLH